VRIKLRDEAVHRAIFSRDLPGKLDATEPQAVDVSRYDLVALAMQEPQYTNHTVRVLMVKIAAAGLPCLSIMNMPPLPYLKRIPSLEGMDLEEAYTNASVWERFQPGLVTLCSPDPQAFRPPEEAANVLHVGLPTHFKSATFADEKHNKLLRELEADIDAVTLDGHDVPVKLKVFDSLFVPLAKWSMLLTGNYRCITAHEPQSIRDAVHGDLKRRRPSTTTWMRWPASPAPTPPIRCRLLNTPRRRKACSSPHRRPGRSRAARRPSNASTSW
jgi:hypothetical protein